MTRRTLLIAGLIALAASLVGAAVEGSVRGDGPGWWGDHMSGYGHMGWWGASEQTSAIEGAPEVVVTATEFAFSPTEVTIPAGEPVNLTLDNAGDLSHDLTIPTLGIRVVAGPGARASTGIEVERAGSYQFLCTYPGHAEAGMTGLLTVSPDQ